MAFEYVAGGAGDEITLRANREAFDRIRLRPRFLVDVRGIDTRTTLFGREMKAPVLIAPCAYNKIIHPDGELEAVRGANMAGVTLVASTSASTSIEEMAAVAERPLWFQLYASSDRGFTKALVEKAIASNCEAICFTVDSPVRGIRDRDTRCCFHLPPGVGRPNLAALSAAAAHANARAEGRAIYSPNLDAGLTWDFAQWLKGVCPVPLLLKGVLTGEDATKAMELGVDGIIVSNHGGRNLDTFPASLEALPEVLEAVDGRAPVLLDGGVRRGTDVLKAMALGASAVLIGRPYLYGLALKGSEGVRMVLEILVRELEMAMALCGRPTIGDIDRSVLW
jgi:4-hydroxymandelate oxidase